MHVLRSSPLGALTLLGLFSNSIALKLGPRAPAFVCIPDAFNLALTSFSAEATPFCSDFISISDVTSTAGTTTPVETSIPTITSFATVTVLSSGTTTQLVTETITAIADVIGNPPIVKRDRFAPEVAVWVQRAYDVAAGKSQPLVRRQGDFDVSSALSSACTCLDVFPSTTTITATASTSTRVITAVDRLRTTVTQGVVTELSTTTVFTTITGFLSAVDSTSDVSLTAAPTGNLSSSAVIDGPTGTGSASNGNLSSIAAGSGATATDGPTAGTASLSSVNETSSSTMGTCTNGTSAAAAAATESYNSTVSDLGVAAPTGSLSPVNGTGNDTGVAAAATITSTSTLFPNGTTGSETNATSSVVDSSSTNDTATSTTTELVIATPTSLTCPFPQPVDNSGFETFFGDETPPWTVEINGDIQFTNEPGTDDAPAFSGLRRGRITSNGTPSELILSQSLLICPNSTYRFSAWAKIPEPDSGCSVAIRVGRFPVAFVSVPSSEGNYDEIVGEVGPIGEEIVDLVVDVTCLGLAPGEVDVDEINLLLADV
ncbi:MAG: hypothetical protein M1823_002103 [Watsoniomyces obsoletus]|nr:MAG: hypothetical protein M1823_002103 [Watsoniomyces obsoletus]